MFLPSIWTGGYNLVYNANILGSSIILLSTILVYGLEGTGSHPGGDEIFRPSRPALWPTLPPVKWVPGFPGGKVRPGRAADHSPPSSAAVMEE